MNKINNIKELLNLYKSNLEKGLTNRALAMQIDALIEEVAIELNTTACYIKLYCLQ